MINAMLPIDGDRLTTDPIYRFFFEIYSLKEIANMVVSDAQNYRDQLCPVTFPAPHELGEFPMSCYRCHEVADS